MHAKCNTVHMVNTSWLYNSLNNMSVKEIVFDCGKLEKTPPQETEKMVWPCKTTRSLSVSGVHTRQDIHFYKHVGV